MGVMRQVTDKHEHVHKFELFSEDPIFDARPRKGRRNSASRRSWGWDCLTCNAERIGFPFMRDAEEDCEKYHAE